MSVFVPIAMFGWIPLVLALFAFLPARRAALAGFLAAWMFLPVAAYRIAGLPDYTKLSATCLGVLLGIAVFDWRNLLALRPAWADAPILLFCLSPFFSSLSGGLGVHDGFSVIFNQALTWGIPYAVGVLYFRSLRGLYELAVGVFAGGLVYVPFCLFEILVSPKLHLWLYGYALGDIDRAEMRFGGWRPMVFMNSGLMVAVWMTAASVIGIWLWRAGLLRRIAGLPVSWLVPVLVATAIWMKSANGWFLLLLGMGLLVAASRWRSGAPVVLVLALIPVYVAVCGSGVWSRDRVVRVVQTILNQERAHSLAYRFRNEEIITRNARERPLLGWGRTSRAFLDRDRVIHPYLDKNIASYAVVDSLWVGVFAMFGAIGLAGFLGSLLLPVALFVRRFPAARWTEAGIAPAAALAIVLLLYTIDHLANGFINPVFMLAAGGLAHCTAKPGKS